MLRLTLGADDRGKHLSRAQNPSGTEHPIRTLVPMLNASTLQQCGPG